MKKIAFIITILAFSFNCNAQTEKIAHRSHSGKDKTFRVAGYNNWGETPGMKAERKKRDAILKAKADSIANKKKTDSLAKPASQKSKRIRPVKKQ